MLAYSNCVAEGPTDGVSITGSLPGRFSSPRNAFPIKPATTSSTPRRSAKPPGSLWRKYAHSPPTQRPRAVTGTATRFQPVSDQRDRSAISDKAIGSWRSTGTTTGWPVAATRPAAPEE